MFAENLSPFFDVAGFGVTATWKRADADGGDVTAPVLFDAETRDVFGEVTANQSEMRYPSNGAFADLADGAIVEINGTRYRARPPKLEGDGTVSVAVMELI